MIHSLNGYSPPLRRKHGDHANRICSLLHILVELTESGVNYKSSRPAHSDLLPPGDSTHFLQAPQPYKTVPPTEGLGVKTHKSMGASLCLNLTDLCIYNDHDHVRVLSNIVHIAKCKLLEGKLCLACSL